MEEHRFILLKKKVDGKIFESQKAETKTYRELKNKKLNHLSDSSNAIRCMT